MGGGANQGKGRGWRGIQRNNQLLQLCTARIAWSDSVIRSASIIKLVSVLFGKCTTLVVTKF